MYPTGGVQYEEHVIFYCELTRDWSEAYGVQDSGSLVKILSNFNYFDFVYEILKRFR